MSASSLRSLAEKLDLSHATVSAALSGKAGVKPSTRAKVVAAAEALGYRGNPLASALMGELRRSRGGVFRGTLAFVSLAHDEREDVSAHSLHEQTLARGAARRAEQLGFKLDHLRIPLVEGDRHRLADTIEARGIRGLLLTHAAGNRFAAHLDWHGLTGILLGVSGYSTGLNRIGPDYHAGIACALHQLHALGYSRPGLVLDASSPGPVLQCWRNACHAGLPDLAATSSARPLVADPHDEARFRRWLSDENCDVVVAHHPRALDWMREAGELVQRTRGFCSLDLLGTEPDVAGLDLRAAATGARAIDLLTNQVLRNETGLPDFPVATLIPPAWVHGDSLRAHENVLETHASEIPATKENLIA